MVLTALAAILAMIPLSRSAFWGPMAVTIMGGLFVATFLTLLFVPALYALWNRRSLREQDDLKTSHDFLFASPSPRRDGSVNNDGIVESGPMTPAYAGQGKRQRPAGAAIAGRSRMI